MFGIALLAGLLSVQDVELSFIALGAGLPIFTFHTVSKAGLALTVIKVETLLRTDLTCSVVKILPLLLIALPAGLLAGQNIQLCLVALNTVFGVVTFHAVWDTAEALPIFKKLPITTLPAY